MQVLGMDTETHLITREKPIPRLVCASFCWAEGMTSALLTTRPEDGLEAYLKEILLSPHVLIVGCNIAFDMAVIGNHYPDLLPLIFDAYKAGRVTDVTIRQNLFNIATGRTRADDAVKYYSLAVLVKMLFGEDIEGKTGDDIWRLRYSELDGVPSSQWPRGAYDYALNDASYTTRIYKEQQEHVGHLFFDDTKQAYAEFAFALMSAWGMTVDPAKVQACEARHRIERDKKAEVLKAAGFIRWNDKRGDWSECTKKVEEYIKSVFAHKGLTPFTTDDLNKNKKKPKKKTNKPPTISRGVENCVLSQDPLLLKYLAFKKHGKILSAFISKLKDGFDGLPLTTWIQMAVTGRTTAETPRQPLKGTNFQQMPKKGGIRECFVPRPGFVYLAADFSGAELHTMAQVQKILFGSSALGDALNSGQNVHLKVGAQVLGISYEEALERYKAGDPVVSKARSNAKPVNFGGMGGMGARTMHITRLKEEEVWDIEDLKTIQKAWRETQPELTAFFALGTQEGYGCVVKTIGWGRLKYVSSFTQANNLKFQAPTADGAKNAVCEVVRRCYVVKESALYGCRLVNFVHDELILEIPNDPSRFKAIVEEFKKVMCDEYNKITPDYPVSVDAALMAYWSKAAEYIEDENGNPVVWRGEEVV